MLDFLKDVRAKIYYNTGFSILLLQPYNEFSMSEMQKKKKKNWRLTDFDFEIKHVKNYPNLDKSILVTRNGLGTEPESFASYPMSISTAPCASKSCLPNKVVIVNIFMYCIAITITES